MYEQYQRSLPEEAEIDKRWGVEIDKEIRKAQEASGTILLHKIFDLNYPLLENMANQLLEGQGYGDLTYPTRMDLTKQQMTAEDVWGYTYETRRDKLSGQNKTRTCFINRLDSGVWQEAETASKIHTTKKVARNAQISQLTWDTMEDYNVSFARHEFASYNEGIYKWLYTKLTRNMTRGWPPGRPREPTPLARNHMIWPAVTE